MGFKYFLEYSQFRIAVKTGISASLAFFSSIKLTQFMNRPDILVSGLWSVVTSIVVIQAYLGSTYQVAWYRFLGTFVGSLLGCCAVVYFGSNPFSLGLGIFISVMTCALLNLKDCARTASISVAVLMILWGLHPENSPWTYAFFRFLDSCIGIVIAMGVAHVIWPLKAAREVRLKTILIISHLNKLYNFATDIQEKISVVEIANTMHETSNLLRQIQKDLEESRIEMRTRTTVEDWRLVIEHMEKVYKTITNLMKLPKKDLLDTFDEPLQGKILDFVAQASLVFEDIQKTLEDRRKSEKRIDLFAAVEAMHEEFNRFQKTFYSQDTGACFVFFYELKNLAEELIDLDDRVYLLYHNSL